MYYNFKNVWYLENIVNLRLFEYRLRYYSPDIFRLRTASGSLISLLRKYLVTLESAIQVNLFQKQLFLHQLTHNMTKELQVPYMKIVIASSKHSQNMLCRIAVTMMKSFQNVNHLALKILWHLLADI